VIPSGLLFAASLAVTLGASELMVRGLTRLGAKLRLSEGLLGLLTALGADAPELSSAVIALLAGARAVGVGVVLGSNLFNLAALLGLSALVSGGLAVHRPALLVDGSVGLAAVLLAGVLIARWLPAWSVALVLLLIFAAYTAALALRHDTLHRLRVPRLLRSALVQAPGHLGHEEAGPGGEAWGPALLLPLAVALVVVGALGLVHSALALAAAWHLPEVLVGAVVLAVLTSLPNAYAALQLGRRGRGTAVLSEAMNSNTLNLLGGLVLPAAVFGLGSLGRGAAAAYFWLVGLTLLVLALCARGRRLRRGEATLVIAGYLAFVVYLVAGA
jgi:cation:H+ antiporter